jgi:DNA-binding SARP family transcriptional activator
MRIQEFRDAYLLIHENHRSYDWSRTDRQIIPSVLDARTLRGSRKSASCAKVRRGRRYWIAFAVWLFVILSLAWATPAGASNEKQSAIDAINRDYRILITNPEDGTTVPSMLMVASATLDTMSPIDSQLHAPRGWIYLTLQMSSGPIQRNYGDPRWGDFFSGIKPLAASALRYVAASGRSYAASRTDPMNQTYNPNATSDDGLVDAKYSFEVPITSRRGTLIISSTRSTGVEYRSFTGSPSVDLDIGGPTKVALAFPKKLTETVLTPTRTPRVPSGETFGNVFNLFATALAVVLAAIVFLRRRRLNCKRLPKQVFVVGSEPIPQPPTLDFEQAPMQRQQPVAPRVAMVVEAESTLRVDVLGPLSISPVNAPASDPVRAIVAYLAMNSERLFTLDEIQTAVWPTTDTGTDIKKPAMRNYMVDVRKVVGARHLPSASGRTGYQLKYFTTDWSEFQALLNQASKSSPDEAAVLRHRALDLTSGPPFAADTRRYFTWTFTSSVVYRMIEAVTTLAHELARDHVLAGDLVGAEAVLRQGLLVDPVSLTLWEDLTDVLLESSDPSLTDLHWRAASLALRSEDVGLLRNRING